MQSRPTPNGAQTPSAPAPTASIPAPPSAREVQILRRMLDAVRFDGVEQLREQIRMLLVHPGSDAALRIYVLHPDAPRANTMGAGRTRLEPIPVRSPQGRLIGELSIWVEGGLLRALHFDRRDQQPILVLPPPEWIELPAPPAPLPSQATGAAPVPTRRSARVPAIAVAAALLLAIALAGSAIGASGGVDLDAARADGAAIGAKEGAAQGAELGTYLGATEGKLAGRVSTYRPSFDAAEKRALAQARAEKLEARRAAEEEAAAAAAAVPASTDNTTCAGYRDATGYWVCT